MLEQSAATLIEALDLRRRRLQRRMNGIVRQVQEERLVLVCRNKGDRFIGQSIGQIFARLSFAQAWQLDVVALVWKEIRRRLPAVIAADVDVETLRFRPVRFVAQM